MLKPPPFELANLFLHLSVILNTGIGMVFVGMLILKAIFLKY